MAMTGGTAAALPMSNHTRERVTVAKLTLENFYSTLLTQHEEREMRSELCSWSVTLLHGLQYCSVYTAVLRSIYCSTTLFLFPAADRRSWRR